MGLACWQNFLNFFLLYLNLDNRIHIICSPRLSISVEIVILVSQSVSFLSMHYAMDFLVEPFRD